MRRCRLCDENIEKLTRELEMLKQPDCRHPEYLAMLRCVDERRDDKIHFETTLFNYKLDCLKNKTVAERHQWHSQYFQTVRDLRDKHLMLCNQRFYQLQKERRNLGSDEFDYTYYFPTKRSTQIQQQTAYNLEVSVLSGVAKYVGFPAAPEIIPVRNNELEEDFRAMKVCNYIYVTSIERALIFSFRSQYDRNRLCALTTNHRARIGLQPKSNF